MGLGKTRSTKSTFLSIAGGYIWDKSIQDKEHEDFAVQAYTMPNGEEKERSGAQYQDLTGMVKSVVVRTHDEFGDSLNIVISSDGELFTISLGIDSRYCGDMMKFLLVGDLESPVFIRPYDFIGENKKRAMGISFRQGGEKISLRVEGQPMKEAEWFKSANKRDIKRFFEDVTDYFKDRINQEIIPLYEGSTPAPDPVEKKQESQKEEETTPKEAEKVKEKSSDEKKAVTPLKMKKFLRAYIKENYSDEKLPDLEKEVLIEWYELALKEEELPFEESEEDSSDKNDVESQLDALTS